MRRVEAVRRHRGGVLQGHGEPAQDQVRREISVLNLLDVFISLQNDLMYASSSVESD